MNLKKSRLILLSLATINCISFASENKIKLDTLSIIDSQEVYSSNTLDMGRLEKNQALDLKDVLNDEASINVSNGKSKSTQKIYLRGIESTNLSISVDGASQGANLFHHRGNIPQIQTDILKYVEISTGGNAETDKGALGGSIIMKTKDAQDFATNDKRVGGVINGSYSSVDKMKTTNITGYGLFDEKYGVYFNASSYKSDDYKRGGDGEKILGTASEGKNYFLKFSMLENENHSLRLSASKNTSEGKEGDDKGAASNSSALSQRDYIILESNTFTAEHKFNPENSLIDVTSNIYKTDTEEEIISYEDGSSTGYKKESIGGKLKNQFSTNIGQTKNTFKIGTDFSQDKSYRISGTPDYYSNGGNPVQAKFVTVKNQNLGIFTQNSTHIENLTINYGARLDKYDFEIGNLQSIKGSKISPNAGLEYQFNNNINIFANYAEASRASGTVSVGFLTHVADQTYTSKGLTNVPAWEDSIDFETSKRKEIGINFNDLNILKKDDIVKLSLTYFDTEIENLIEVYAGGTRGLAVTGLTNSEDLVESKGFEIKTSWEYDKWFTSLNYTNSKTTIGGEVQQISFANRIAAASGDKLVLYTNYKVTPSLSFGYTLSAIDSIQYQDKSSMPGYTTHGLDIQWIPQKIKDLTLTFSVNNLTDKKYEDQTSTYSDDSSRTNFYEPGRDFRLGIKYKF